MGLCFRIPASWLSPNMGGYILLGYGKGTNNPSHEKGISLNSGFGPLKGNHQLEGLWGSFPHSLLSTSE